MLKCSTTVIRMATVNFSVPDDVKAEFDKVFGDQNKSAVIAELMRDAVAEAKRRKQRESHFPRADAAPGAAAVVVREAEPASLATAGGLDRRHRCQRRHQVAAAGPGARSGD